MSFDPLQNDRKQASQLGSPIAISPQGDPIFAFGHLPNMPIPRLVRVKADQLEIDGWIFPYFAIKKGTLQFLRDTMERWIKEDDSRENRAWIAKIAEAFYQTATEKGA
jgi:hypothetical protein